MPSELRSSDSGYYRTPSLHADRIVFACEDDLWTVSSEGGIARRLTANPGRAAAPALSPDGRLLAYVGHDEGSPEIYCMPAEGGPAERLTFLGAYSSDTAWTPGGRIVFASDAAQAFAGLTTLFTVASEGGEPQPLAIGPAVSISFGAEGGRVIGRNTSDIARWKRYRGGLTGDLWVDPLGDGDWRRLIELTGNLARPLWIGQRIYFVSDHEGIGNLYSATPMGEDLQRHTDHADFYVRHPATDGQRIIYQAGADLYLLEVETGAQRKIEVQLRSSRSQRKRRFVSASAYLQAYDLHPDGHFLAVTTRGKAISMGNWEGAVWQHGVAQGVHNRLTSWLNDGRRLAIIADGEGEETLEIHDSSDPSAAARRFSELDLGRVSELLPAPEGELVALCNQRHELMVVDLAEAQLRSLDRSRHGAIRGMAWSPDGRWLAYGFANTAQTTIIRLCRLEDGQIFDATEAVLHDWAPNFDPEGRFLFFLSSRDFDPVYDNVHFDLGFPFGVRPHLLTLRADLGSPFIPIPHPLSEDSREPDTEEPEEAETEGDESEGDETEGDETEDGAEATEWEDGEAENGESEAGGEESDGRGGRSSGAGSAKPKKGAEAPSPIEIDLEGIRDRVIAFPVPEGQYSQVAGLGRKVIYSHFPLESTLKPSHEGESGKGTIEAYDLESQEESTLVHGISDFCLSIDGKTLAYRSGKSLRVIKAGEKPSKDGPPGRKSGWIDLDRIRLSVDPMAEWSQMYREAWRLQRDQFWTADMSGVDWLRVYERYLPLIERVATRAEFSDLMWEMQGELGTSHAYEIGGDYRAAPRYAQGFLGADLNWDADTASYRVERIVRGDPWDEEASSPLARAGAGVRVGDRLLTVDGRKLNRETGPAELLVNCADCEITLSFAAREPEPSADLEAEARAPEPSADVETDAGASEPSADVETEAGEPEPSADLEADADPGPGVESADGAADGAPESSSQPWTITVKTLASELPARYRDWVSANRRAVHTASDGRLGYVHIPDMGARGYAEFHRGYLAELVREGLVVDLRFNGGGHVSQLILEKLARRHLGYDVQRWGEPLPYPAESVLGPIVALTNEQAGSDGDMFSHAFKLMRLGPLIGKRTWGGVVGIHPKSTFVDGGYTTQPEFSMWFRDVGFGLENFGTEPDIEVEMSPQDHAAGRDPQLERAIEEALRLLVEQPPERPEFGERPRLPLPDLPAKS